MNLVDASSFPGVTADKSTFTIKTTGSDSTAVYFDVTSVDILASVIGQTDSTKVTLIKMSGFTDERNASGSSVNWQLDNSFIFAPADTLTITTAGTYSRA